MRCNTVGPNNPYMNQRLACLLHLATALAASTVATARAEEDSLAACIGRYTALGLSADLAYGECKKNTLSECVKNLMAGKYVASSIKHIPTEKNNKESGYLIDLGNTESRWLEGAQWAEKGCYANTTGPYKREETPKKGVFGKRKSYQWFRQGWCFNSSIELEQPYALEEAKLRCELGATPEKPKQANEFIIKIE